jgi:Flp pilus assembly protein TadB
VEHATKSMSLAIAIAFVGIWAVTAASITAVWLTEEVRVAGLVALPTALVAALLVVYFEWRARRQRQILAPREDLEHLDRAA